MEGIKMNDLTDVERKLSPLRQEIITAIRKQPGSDKDEIYDIVRRHMVTTVGSLGQILSELEKKGLIESTKKENSRTRLWFPLGGLRDEEHMPGVQKVTPKDRLKALRGPDLQDGRNAFKYYAISESRVETCNSHKAAMDIVEKTGGFIIRGQIDEVTYMKKIFKCKKIFWPELDSMG
jgi:hypothetical protein